MSELPGGWNLCNADVEWGEIPSTIHKVRILVFVVRSGGMLEKTMGIIPESGICWRYELMQKNSQVELWVKVRVQEGPPEPIIGILLREETDYHHDWPSGWGRTRLKPRHFADLAKQLQMSRKI